MKLTAFLKYLILALIAVALLWVAFRGVNLHSLVEELKEANLFWISTSLLAAILAFLSRAYRWKLLIDPLGHNTSFQKATYSLMVGYLANLVFPRLGELTRCGSLSKANKIPFDQLIGTVIVERVMDVICLIAFIIFTAIIESERLGNFFFLRIIYPMREKFVSLSQSPVLWVTFIIIFVIGYFIFKARKRSGKHGIMLNRIDGLIKGIGKGLRSFRTIEKPWQFLFHTIFIWALYFLMAYVCFFSLPSTANLNWQAAMFVLVAGGIGMSAPVQGGIGAYHLLVSQGLVLYGIPYQHALAFATLLHTSQVLLVILLGVLSLLFLFLSKNKTSADENA